MNYFKFTKQGVAMASEITPRWMAVSMLLLCLVCGAASAQTGAVMRVVLSSTADPDTGGVLVPVTDPYCSITGPGSYTPCTGVTVSSVPAPVDNVSGSHGVVDWVLVELRESASSDAGTVGAATVVARKAAFLLSNGRVVDAAAFVALSTADRNSCVTGGSGTSLATSTTCPDVVFDGASVNDNLYIVVRHRNHLDVMSATPAAASGNVYNYDFSVASNRAYLDVQKVFIGGSETSRPGIAMMVGGDATQDNQILLVGAESDVNVARPFFGVTGYRSSDINMNGDTGLTDDVQDFMYNNLGTSSPVPE